MMWRWNAFVMALVFGLALMYGGGVQCSVTQSAAQVSQLFQVDVLQQVGSLGAKFTGEASSSVTVLYQDGHLSVSAEQIPLAQILRMVALKTGVEIKGFEGLKREVSVRFSQLPLIEGVRRLLQDVSHILISNPSPQGESRIIQVVVLGQRSGPSSEALGDEQESDPAQALVNRVDPGLTTHLDASVRRWAVERLSEQGGEEGFAALLESLEDQDASVRQATLAGIAQHGAAAIEPIKALLGRESHPEVRATAVQLLGQLGGEDEDDLLRTMLDDQDVRIRVAVVEALGYGGSPMATEALTRAARDPEPAVRMAALSTLAYYVQDDAARAAIEQGLLDDDETVREAAGSLSEVFEAQNLRQKEGGDADEY